MGKSLIEAEIAATREGGVTRVQIRELREELERERAEGRERERQLERYASDLSDIFKAERRRSDQLRESYVATVRALTNAVEARDAYTGKHAERVAAYGLELARRISPALAADPQTEFGFLLHDVGKVAIPDDVLHKAGDLTADEEALMRRHPEIGQEIVAHIRFLDTASLTVRYHHERWDGCGYPDGLAEREIPLAARIFAVGDALDAMTTDRPYRPGMPFGAARAEIEAAAGTQFDPTVVEMLDHIPDELFERLRAQTG
ncbi:MAG: HD domain-containing phosphohydrolase [Thermoleophilaceae bacterium]